MFQLVYFIITRRQAKENSTEHKLTRHSLFPVPVTQKQENSEPF